MKRDETPRIPFSRVTICQVDGRGIISPLVGRRRTYCSGRCRTRAWRARQRDLTAHVRRDALTVLTTAWVPTLVPSDD